MLRRVVSGGQTGADHGGVQAARDCGLKTGGWMPRGWRTEDGPRGDAAEFGYREHDSEDWLPRTEANARDSDATVVFAKHTDSPGTSATFRFCDLHSKPWLGILLVDGPPSLGLLPSFLPVAVEEFITGHGVEVLNVAGNRESEAPGIEAFVRDYLTEVFGLLGRELP